MVSLLAAAAFAAPWVPSPEGRFAVATEVLLPHEVWVDEMGGDFGFETRSWSLRAVLVCASTPGKRDRLEVTCTVDDAALQASSFQRTPDDDPAQARAVLESFVRHLRATTLHTTLSPRGRRLRWSVEGEPEGSSRHTAIGRLTGRMLERAAVGLFVERPRSELEVGGQWVESSAALLSYPMEEGAKALGTSQLLLQIRELGDEVVLDGAGEGAMLDPVTSEQLRSKGRLAAQWSATGAMRSITWSVDASVLDVVRYHHAGWIRRLGADETVELGPTRQVRAPGVGPEGDLPGLPAWPEL